VLVEFALVFLLFLLLLVGATEFGRAWYTVHMLSSAAREGARVGALLGGDADRDAAIRARIGEVLAPAGFEDYEVTIAEGGGYGQPLKVEVESTFEIAAASILRVDPELHLKGTAVFNQELP
jgi:hypothetical protein